MKNIESDPDFKRIMDECDRILGTKGSDYTAGGRRAHGKLANFYAVAERAGLSPLKVWAVYFGKHLDAIDTFVRQGALASEPIEGRICDAINYLLILAKLIEYERDTTLPAHAPGGGE